MITPNSRFLEFLADINPSDTTVGKSRSAHSDIRGALESDREFKTKVKRTFLGGSYRRDTAIRPVTKDGTVKRPDIDSYVVVDGENYFLTPSQWMNEVCGVLERNRSALGLSSITRNRCSVATTTSKADVDVSVLLDKRHDNLYRIGNKDSEEWYATNPETHTEWSTTQNANFQHFFKPMVKLLKWAMRVNPTKFKHPKSFALEVLIARNMQIAINHYGELFCHFCRNFLNKYYHDRSIGNCPFLEDPAVLGANILAGVEDSAFCAFYDKIRFFYTQATKAINASNCGEATTHWRQIFGDRFPATKRNVTSTLKPAQKVSPPRFGTQRVIPPAIPARFA